MSYNPIPNDLSETHIDTSLEAGQRPQLSTNRSWQTLKGTKWRQNKSSQIDTTTQANSGLWVDQQPRYSKVSVPTWNPETKKHSSKLWKSSANTPSIPTTFNLQTLGSGLSVKRVKLDRDFSNRDTLHSALSQFSNLTELEVHVNLTKAKKNHLDSKKDLNAIKIDVDNNSEHTATITTFNEFVKASVTKYESGDALDSDLNALALHNMILIQPGDNNYGIKANDWDRFKDFAQGDSVPTPTQLNVVEKDVC
ncbi:hypothetical protein G6F38_011494 [Rhizopus arrhizus]|nr:hypothetical protein G6F38_011494 [Rhizopus arrhizus]